MLLEIRIRVIVETPSTGGYIGDYLGDFHRAIKGEIRTLDNGSISVHTKC